MRGRKLIGVVLSGAFMLGCSDGVLVHSEVVYDSDVRSHLVYAATKSSIQTRIQNNPFPSSAGVLNLTVTNALGGQHQDLVTRVEPERAKSEHGLYNLILRFEPPDTLGGLELCQGNEGPPAASVEGRIRLLAAFCLGDEVLSEARGWAGNVKSANDPAFIRLVQQVFLAMFPADNREVP